MSRYPHDWSIDALSCRACRMPRVHADPSVACMAALVARVAELERHVGSLHKAAAAGRDAERAAAVAFLLRPCGQEGHDDRWCERCSDREDMASALRSGDHLDTTTEGAPDADPR